MKKFITACVAFALIFAPVCSMGMIEEEKVTFKPKQPRQSHNTRYADNKVTDDGDIVSNLLIEEKPKVLTNTLSESAHSDQDTLDLPQITRLFDVDSFVNLLDEIQDDPDTIFNHTENLIGDIIHIKSNPNNVPVQIRNRENQLNNVIAQLEEHNYIQPVQLQRKSKVWQTIVKELAYVVRGVSVGAAITPVFLTEIEEAGISLENNDALRKGLIWYTLLSFGLENYFNRGIEKIQRITFNDNKWKEAAWYMGNLLYSAFPAYLLFETEFAHREEVGGTGFDEYAAYATFFGTALLINDLLLTQQMGWELLKPFNISNKERGIDRLNKENLDNLITYYDGLNLQESSISMFVPMGNAVEAGTPNYQKNLSYILPILAYVPTLMTYQVVFNLAGRFIDPSGDALYQTSYVMGAVAAGIMSYIQYHTLHSHDLFTKSNIKKNLLALPQGFYKSIPFLVMSMKGTETWPWVLRIPLLACSSMGNILVETLETEKAFETGILRLPKVRDTLEGKKLRLKDKLV